MGGGGEQRAVLAQLSKATASTIITVDTPSPGRPGGCHVREAQQQGSRDQGAHGVGPDPVQGSCPSLCCWGAIGVSVTAAMRTR